VNNFLLEQQQLEEKLAILTEFIQSNSEAREIKRAVAVKMALSGEPYSKITKMIGMHKSCITIWKQKFEAKGLDGIKLAYQGSPLLFDSATTAGNNYDAAAQKILELR
jgi:putative transposase